MPVGSNACRSSAWVRTIPSSAFSWYTQDSSYFSMKSRVSRGRSRISCRTSSVRSSRSMYRVRLTVLLLLQPLETLARSAGGQVTGSCQSTALLSGNHGSLRHSADPRVGRVATFPVGRARFRNLRRSRDIPPRSEEHTSELQSRSDLVCRLLLEKKKKKPMTTVYMEKNNNSRIQYR